MMSFGRQLNPAKAYSQLGLETTVLEANPHRLILLLFEGALTAIMRAGNAMDAGRIAEKGEMISRALDIIGSGLRASLDLEAGGDLAERLAALYDYMCERLLWANVKNDRGAIDEVRGLLGEIHEAWKAIEPKNGAEGP